MAYASTSNISIFPFSKKRDESVDQDRILLEKRLANILRQAFRLGDPNTGVLFSFSHLSNYAAQFNLWGYYIDCTNIPASGVGNFLIASVKIRNDEVDGSDNNGSFEGVEFDVVNSYTPIEQIGGVTYYRMTLAEKVSGEFIAYEPSMKSLQASDMNIAKIDGKI